MMHLGFTASNMESIIEKFSPTAMFGGKRGPPPLEPLGEPVCVPCGELGQLPCDPLPKDCSKDGCPIPQCYGDLEVFNLLGYIQETGDIDAEDIAMFFRIFFGRSGRRLGTTMERPCRDKNCQRTSLPPQLYFLFLGLNICLPKPCKGLDCLVKCDPKNIECRKLVRASLNATAADLTPVPPEPTETTLIPPEPTD